MREKHKVASNRISHQQITTAMGIITVWSGVFVKQSEKWMGGFQVKNWSLDWLKDSGEILKG